jgi:hypothetical protein
MRCTLGESNIGDLENTGTRAVPEEGGTGLGVLEAEHVLDSGAAYLLSGTGTGVVAYLCLGVSDLAVALCVLGLVVAAVRALVLTTVL